MLGVYDVRVLCFYVRRGQGGAFILKLRFPLAERARLFKKYKKSSIYNSLFVIQGSSIVIR